MPGDPDMDLELKDLKSNARNLDECLRTLMKRIDELEGRKGTSGSTDPTVLLSSPRNDAGGDITKLVPETPRSDEVPNSFATSRTEVVTGADGVKRTFLTQQFITSTKTTYSSPTSGTHSSFLMGSAYSGRLVWRTGVGGETLLQGLTVREEAGQLKVARILNDSPLASQDLLGVGDVILEVNGSEVKTPDELTAALKASGEGVSVKIVPCGLERAPLSDGTFVRAHVDYAPNKDDHIPCKEIGLPFKVGDILQVISKDDPQWWQARNVREWSKIGLIPSESFEETRKAGSGVDDSRKKALGGLISVHKRRKIMYNSNSNGGVDSGNVGIYEEVGRLCPFGRRVVVLVGAPGVGRRTLKAMLLAQFPEAFATVVPFTSREAKSGEQEGREYYFKDRKVGIYEEVGRRCPFGRRVVVLVGAPGVGRRTLKAMLLAQFPEAFATVVPFTSREAKSGEQDGREYYFKDRKVGIYEEVGRRCPFGRRVVVLVGAPGVGRRTLKAMLLAQFPEAFATVVPFTSREAKSGEQDGREYYFKDRKVGIYEEVGRRCPFGRRVVVLVGAPGVGRRTLKAMLLAQFPEAFATVVSFTSREAKSGEQEGREYYFKDRKVGIYEEVGRLCPFGRRVVVLVGAPGVGRRTLKAMLLAQFPEAFATVVSFTSREAKSGEQEGREYYFKDRKVGIYEEVGRLCPFGRRVVVLVGAPGVGRRTLKAMLLAQFPEAFAIVVSFTSREAKSGEQEGREYYFKDRKVGIYEEVGRRCPFGRRVVVLVGAPGVGRRTLKAMLLAQFPEAFVTVVPFTSREAKSGEQEGREYYFKDRKSLQKEVDGGGFLEWGEFNGNLYGTSLASVRAVVKTGRLCVLDCSPQAIQLLYNEEFMPYVVYVGPPPLEELRQLYKVHPNRTKPKTDNDLNGTCEAAAEMEAAYAPLFDLHLVNRNVDVTFRRLTDALESLKTETQWVPISWLYG